MGSQRGECVRIDANVIEKLRAGDEWRCTNVCIDGNFLFVADSSCSGYDVVLFNGAEGGR